MHIHHKNQQNSEIRPNRLIFHDNKKGGGTGKKEEQKTPEKVAQFYGKAGIEAAMKKHAGQYMDSPDWRLLKERLYRTDTPIDLKKRFISDLRKPSSKDGDKRRLLRIYKRKAENLQGQNSPFKTLTKLTLKDEGYDVACNDLLIVKEKGNDAQVAKHLIQAHLEYDGIADSKTFKLWAKKLRSGTAEQKELIRNALGRDIYMLTPEKLAEVSAKLAFSDVTNAAQNSDEDLAIKGLRKDVQEREEKALEAVDRKAESSPEWASKNAECTKSTKNLHRLNSDYNLEQKGLDSFMRSQVQIDVKGDPDKISQFLSSKTKEKGKAKSPAARKQALSQAFVDDILDATLEAEDRTGKKSTLFKKRWSNFVEQAGKAGITIKMPPEHSQAIVSRLQKLDEINEKREKESIVLRDIRRFFVDTEQRKIDGVKQRFRSIERSGIMLPMMIDHEGKAIPEKECNIPIVMRDKYGKMVKARISMVRSGAHTGKPAEGEGETDIELRKRLLKEELDSRTGALIVVFDGKDSHGNDLDEISYNNLQKVIERKGLRQDFEAESDPVKAAQKALNEHDILKSSIQLQKGERILHTHQVREKADRPEEKHANVARIGQVPQDTYETRNDVVTITNDPSNGFVTLDQEIVVMPLELQEVTKQDEDWIKFVAKYNKGELTEEEVHEMILNNGRAVNTDTEYRYKAGSKIPLNEFMSWLMRNDVTEYADRVDVVNQKLREAHEAHKELLKGTDVGMDISKEPAQITTEWSTVQSRHTGSIYTIRQNTEDKNKVDICRVERETLAPVIGESAKAALARAQNRDWRATAAETKSAADALKWFRSQDIEQVDEATSVTRAERTNYSGSPRAAAYAGAATRELVERSKKVANGWGTNFTVQEPKKKNTPYAFSYDAKNKLEGSGMGMAGSGRAGANMGISELNAANANPDPDFKPVPVKSPEDQEIEKVISKIGKGEDSKASGLTPGALPILHDTDVAVRYHSTSFLTKIWRNTTVLTNNNIWEMGKAMYEYTTRRWDRNEKDRYSTVGKHLPWYGTEMDRINQAAENEEVNQFKEAMADWGIWQIEDELYGTSNKDKAKACFITLAEKGKIRWDDVRLWETLNRLTDGKYHIHIPANRDPQVKDPRTGKVGVELLPGAIDSLWGENQYNDWYTQNASKYHSKTKEYDEEGKQLEADPYNNGTVTGRLSQLLTMHREGEYVDPHEYEGLIHFIINAGKSDLENKVYFLVQGVAAENHRGQTILTWDRLGSINGEFLNRLPWLDFFVKRNVKRADGRTTGWQKADFQRWSKMFDAGEHPEHKNKATGNKVLWDFVWQTVLNDDKTLVRTNKGLRNAQDMDHDDAHFIIPLASESVVTDVLSGPTGSKKYFTYEGYANAFPGYGEVIKQRSKLGPKATGLIFDTLKAFIRYDSVMDNRYLRAEGSKYARLDKSYLRRPSVVSGIPTGIHIEQIRNLIREICHSYGYSDVEMIFEKVPPGEEFEERQKRIETEIARFGEKLEGLIKTDGGRAMMGVVNKHVNSNLITGLDPSITPEQKNAGMEAAKEGAEGSALFGQFG